MSWDADFDDRAPIDAAGLEVVLGMYPERETEILTDPLLAPPPFWWGRSTLQQRRAALHYTVTFTEWLIRVWRIERKQLPPCWVLHPDLVVEMSALAMAHAAMHHRDNPTGPAQWLLYLDYQRTRLADNNAAAGCASRGHHELIGQGAEQHERRHRHYGEGDDATPELPVDPAELTWPPAASSGS